MSSRVVFQIRIKGNRRMPVASSLRVGIKIGSLRSGLIEGVTLTELNCANAVWAADVLPEQGKHPAEHLWSAVRATFQAESQTTSPLGRPR